MLSILEFQHGIRLNSSSTNNVNSFQTHSLFQLHDVPMHPYFIVCYAKQNFTQYAATIH